MSSTPQFPRTTVAGVSLPRMLIGSNWMMGYSHTGPAADKLIIDRNYNRKAICDILEAYLQYGVNAVMAPFGKHKVLQEAVADTEQRLGCEIIRIDTPIVNVDDSAQAREEARQAFAQSAALGSRFCLIHHFSAEQLVDKNREEMRRLPDYLSMIREAGMLPGLSAHMPELILYSDRNGYDVETYIQIFNCMGFLMQVEVETVAKIIHNAQKPVMTIKPMAAGRVSPYIGLTFSYAALRGQDMVTVGAFTPEEVHEDVEIGLAAIDRRFPALEQRQSPAAEQSVLKDDPYGKATSM